MVAPTIQPPLGVECRRLKMTGKDPDTGNYTLSVYVLSQRGKRLITVHQPSFEECIVDLNERLALIGQPEDQQEISY